MLNGTLSETGFRQCNEEFRACHGDESRPVNGQNPRKTASFQTQFCGFGTNKLRLKREGSALIEAQGTRIRD
jgi:hypothetical protein